MAFEDFSQKDSVIVVYTGEGKGKTSAGIGLTVRALGAGWRVAFLQFIKHWTVNEHRFFQQIEPIFKDQFVFYKGGKGFYNAGDISAKNVSEIEHKQAAQETLAKAVEYSTSGHFQLVVCDEINNAVHDGLLEESDLKKLVSDHHKNTSLCFTGRDFPEELLDSVDIATNMTKLRHHFDDKFLANSGIDY